MSEKQTSKITAVPQARERSIAEELAGAELDAEIAKNQAASREIDLAVEEARVAAQKINLFSDGTETPPSMVNERTEGHVTDTQTIGSIEKLGAKVAYSSSTSGDRLLTANRVAAHEDGSTTDEAVFYRWYHNQHGEPIDAVVVARTVDAQGNLTSIDVSREPDVVRQRGVDIINTVTLHSAAQA